MKRLGVDVGGTFTDLVLWDDSWAAPLVHKLPSNPSDPAEAIVRGVSELCDLAGIELDQVDLLLHGTTVATNMVLERDGAKCGMLTTHGFRDIMHIARKKRPYNFSSSQDVPWQKYPLVKRRYRISIPERVVPPSGEIETPLDEGAVRAAVKELKAAGVEAIAVCFLFSFLNPSHELRTAEIVREEFPEAFVSTSSGVVPLFREYERFATTAMNVYVGPKTGRYIHSLSRGLEQAGARAGLRLMTSAGGMVTGEAAAELPVSLLMSGPAAGLIAGIESGTTTGSRNVVTLDVGGTSSDIGLSSNGALRMKHLLDTKVGDYQIMIPMLDLETLGAGGGSIASVTAEGVLEAGPRSAGAFPGPVCYGRGGTEPTATDAMAVLGWIRPETFFGGHLQLDVASARSQIKSMIGGPLGLSPEEAALGVHTVLSHAMANAITQLCVRRGLDFRDYDLVAQGGAGPMFACSVAREVGMKRVVIPPLPGLASAVGLLSTDLRYELAATAYQDTRSPDLAELRRLSDGLLSGVTGRLEADGLITADMTFELFADCRYEGQGYELRVAAPGGPVDREWWDTTIEQFHNLHESTYLTRFEDVTVELVNIRVVGIGHVPKIRLSATGTQTDGEAVPIAEIDSWYRVDDEAKVHKTTVYHRADLRPGHTLEGPTIIEQPDSTVVLEPGFQARVEESGHIIVELPRSHHGP